MGSDVAPDQRSVHGQLEELLGLFERHHSHDAYEDHETRRRQWRRKGPMCLAAITSDSTSQGCPLRPVNYISRQATHCLQNIRARAHGLMPTTTTQILCGERIGRVDDAMSVLSTSSPAILSFLGPFIFGPNASLTLDSVLEPPGFHAPFRSLSSKRVVLRRCRLGRVISTLEVPFLEYTGTTRAKDGAELGFHVIQSSHNDCRESDYLDMNVPERLKLSIATIYRQKSVHTVEVFMQATANLPIADLTKHMISMTRALECGEAVRLGPLVEQRRRVHGCDAKRSPPAGQSRNCALCTKAKREVSTGVVFQQCSLCGETVCRSCRVTRDVLVEMGHAERVACCKGCIATIRGAAGPAIRVPSESDGLGSGFWTTKSPESVSMDASQVSSRYSSELANFGGWKMMGKLGKHFLQPSKPNPPREATTSPFAVRSTGTASTMLSESDAPGNSHCSFPTERSLVFELSPQPGKVPQGLEEAGPAMGSAATRHRHQQPMDQQPIDSFDDDDVPMLEDDPVEMLHIDAASPVLEASWPATDSTAENDADDSGDWL